MPFPCSLKAITHATGSKIRSSRSRWNRGTEYYPVGVKTHIYTLTYFFENIVVLTTLKWAPTFSSICYEQVALLHPPNRLASVETEEFLPKHVPHVQKDHIGKIHLVHIPVGRQTGPQSPEYLTVQFKGYNSCYRIQNRKFSVLLEQEHKILPCRNENSYRVPSHIFLKI